MTEKKNKDFKVYQLPIWTDNYIYILEEKKENKVAVIDPGEAGLVNEFLEKKNLKLRFHFKHSSSSRSCGWKLGT